MKTFCNVLQLVEYLVIVVLLLTFKFGKKNSFNTVWIRLCSSVYIIIFEIILLHLNSNSLTMWSIFKIILVLFALWQTIKNAIVLGRIDANLKRENESPIENNFAHRSRADFNEPNEEAENDYGPSHETGQVVNYEHDDPEWEW